MSKAYAQSPEGTTAPETDLPVPDGPTGEPSEPVETDTAEPTTNAAPETVGTDEPGQVDVSPRAIMETVDSWVDGFVRLLPNIAVALVVLLLFYVVGVIVRRLFVRWASRRERVNLGEVFGSFLKWAIVLVGLLLALTIVVPTLRPGDLIAGLGIGSVAIGFAFKDILQNWLAGMLILFRQPFEIGDQIIVQGYEGTVDRIETRATFIRTYDGRRAIIPNSDVYTNAVLVNTANPVRRSQYDVGIGYGDDIDAAVSVMMDAMKGLSHVESDPAPDVLVRELADSAVVLRPRWWTDSRRADVMHVHSEVVRAIKLGLDGAGIDMPFETHVHLFHDQTEEADGRRGEQREGWPAGDAAPLSRFDAAKSIE